MPIKQKNLSQKKRSAVKYLKLAKSFYRTVCKLYQIDYKIFNVFNLKYQNCKKQSKEVQKYTEEINRIKRNYSYYVSTRSSSNQFRRFISLYFSETPIKQKEIIIDTKKIQRKIQFESENGNSSQIQPKPEFHRSEKIQKFPQLNNTESSYIASLILT